MDRLDYSMERWRSLEHFRQERLFLKTGLLNLGPPGDPWLERHMAVVRAAGKKCDWLDSGEIHRRWPMLRYPAEWGAAFDPDGGLLFAHRCLAAVQARFRALGGAVINARADELEPLPGGGVSLRLRRNSNGRQERIDCDRAVVCAGPWTGRLLPELAPLLQTLAIPVTYWRDESGLCEAAEGFPIIYNARLKGVYGLPACEYPGLVKVLYHGGPEAEPENRDQADRQPWVDQVSAYVREHLPALDHRRPAIQETCMYTMSPDSEPVIDRVAGAIVVGCGFSGSGFKHSPASGRMLAALALEQEGSLPAGFRLSAYRRSRFSTDSR